MANPIKHSDLIIDDGAIADAIKQLEELVKVQGASLDKIKKQAAGLEKNLSGLNTTTAANREEVAAASKQAEQIEKRYEKYNQTLTDTGIKLAALKEAQRKANLIQKNTAKLNMAAEGSYDALSAQYSLIKLRLNQMSAAERKATEEGRKLEKQSKEIFDEMKRLQEVTGKHTLNVGNYKNAIVDAAKETGIFGGVLRQVSQAQSSASTIWSSYIGLIGGSIKGVTGLSRVLRILKVALISTGIGAIVVALGSLIAAFAGTQKGVDTLNRVLIPLQTVLDKVWGLVQDLAAKGFDKLTKAVEDPKKAFKSLGDIIKKNITNRIEGLLAMGPALRKVFSKDWKQGLLEFGEAGSKAITGIDDLTGKLINTAKAAADGMRQLGNEIKEGFDQGGELARLTEEIERSEIALIKRAATLETIFNKEKLLAAQAPSDEEKIAALRRASAAQDELLALRQRHLDLQIRQQQIQNSLNDTSRAEEKALAELEAQRIRAASDAASRQTEIASQLTGLIKKQMEERKRIEEKFVQDSLKLEKKRAQEIVKVNQQLGVDLGAVAKEITAQQVEAINQQVEAVGLNIYEQLGIDEPQKEAIKESFKFALQQVADYVQKRVEISSQLVQQANTEIASAERMLQAEIAAAQAGYASRVDIARKDLDDARKNQQKALQEQQKAQKAQERIQTIQQAGNLITATTKIWALRPILAIPLIAIMWGSFLANKIKAAQLTKKKFSRGGFEALEGGSHSSGNDIPLGITSDGRERRAEGGEGLAIFSRKGMAQYGAFIPGLVKAINTGTLQTKVNRMNATGATPVFVQSTTDTRKMENELSQIRKQGEGKIKTYHNSLGQLVEIRGNIKTTYVQ